MSTTWTNVLDGSVIWTGADEVDAEGTLGGGTVIATGGTTARTLADRFADTVTVLDFSAAGDGATDDTAALQAAINSGAPLFIPAGTYLVSGLTLLSGSRLVGAGYTRTIIKLKDGANANVLSGTNTSDTYLADFKVDGNKANQTDGLSLRGVYYSGGGTRQTAHRLWVTDCKDHGYMHSTASGYYSNIIECQFTNCGSAAHSSAGGPGGTGCAAGGVGVRIIRCDASGNYLNGFKCGGAYHEHCVSQTNGSGYETGFLSGSKTYHTTYFNCHSWNNASGMNHQGQGDSITIQGGSVEGNTSNGIRFVGDVNRARIIGVRFLNNGSDLVRTGDSLGPDAIGLYSNTSAPDGIVIDECEFVIDDGISTADRYAVYIENSAGSVQVGKRNSSTGYAQAVYCADTAKGVAVEGFPGFSGHYTAPAAVTLTGVATADLASVTVKARELVNRRLRLTAHGTVSGTAGTKLVRLTFGGASTIPINQAAGDQQRWSLEVDITVTSAPDIRAVITACEDGGTSAVYTLRAAPGTVDVTFAINATANGAADVITLTDFRLRTLE